MSSVSSLSSWYAMGLSPNPESSLSAPSPPGGTGALRGASKPKMFSSSSGRGDVGSEMSRFESDVRDLMDADEDVERVEAELILRGPGRRRLGRLGRLRGNGRLLGGLAGVIAMLLGRRRARRRLGGGGASGASVCGLGVLLGKESVYMGLGVGGLAMVGALRGCVWAPVTGPVSSHKGRYI